MRGQTPLAALLLVLAVPAQAPRPVTRPQARLEGQVIDPRHEPVANAEVFVEHDGIVVAHTRSDGLGTFVFAAVPAEFVVVRATTDAPDVGGVLVDLWGQHRAFTWLRTMPARELSGTVRDEAGNPIANAWIGAAPSGAPDLAYACCNGRSDADGHYRLRHVAMGPVQVRAWTEQRDAAAFVSSIEGHTDATLDCVVTADTADWCTFRLLDATAEQCAGARLRVIALHDDAQMPMPPELARPPQSEPGRWELHGWTADDELHAWVELDGATMWPVEHVLEVGVGTTTRRFRIGDQDGLLRGRLLANEGIAADGIGLLLQPFDGGVSPLNCRRQLATTTADGSFSIQAPVNTGAKFALRSTSRATVLVGNNSNPVWFVERHDIDKQWQLALRRASSVRVLVTDRHDTPACGIDATLSVADDRNDRVIGNGTSGLDGLVDIPCLGIEPHVDLVLEARGAAGGGTMQTRIKVATDIELGTLRLEPGATIRGVVVAGRGRPLPGARVELQVWRGVMREHLVIGTDRTGQFEFRGVGTGACHLITAGAARAFFEVEPGDVVDMELKVNG
ncbi:MAG: carboxypeptidase regulatory-like domain-containing protein [Planctomycetes bacterium]|nr:carboxypeptidase regulatory-like domain-containing protein [Planctomycetota bacterium]